MRVNEGVETIIGEVTMAGLAEEDEDVDADDADEVEDAAAGGDEVEDAAENPSEKRKQ